LDTPNPLSKPKPSPVPNLSPPLGTQAVAGLCREDTGVDRESDDPKTSLA
jgi:hypothetical protein